MEADVRLGDVGHRQNSFSGTLTFGLARTFHWGRGVEYGSRAVLYVRSHTKFVCTSDTSLCRGRLIVRTASSESKETTSPLVARSSTRPDLVRFDRRRQYQPESLPLRSSHDSNSDPTFHPSLLKRSLWLVPVGLFFAAGRNGRWSST
jgi:hypothetical protein